MTRRPDMSTLAGAIVRESPMIVTHAHALTLVNHGAGETPSAGLENEIKRAA